MLIHVYCILRCHPCKAHKKVVGLWGANLIVTSYPGSTQLFDRTREKRGIEKLGGVWVRGYLIVLFY